MAEDSFEKARRAFFVSAKQPLKLSTAPAELNARSEPPQKNSSASFQGTHEAA
jgi:hypothetical protein